MAFTPPLSCNENTFTLEYLSQLGSQGGVAKIELVEDDGSVAQEEDVDMAPSADAQEESAEEEETKPASLKKEKVSPRLTPAHVPTKQQQQQKKTKK